MNYTTLYIMMIGIFLSYVLFISIKYGIQKSISQSYYVLPKNIRFIFTLFCWGFSIPVIIIGSTPLMFFAGSGIAFVGAAAAFKGDKLTFDVHMASAFGGVILSQISTCIDFGMWYLTLIFTIISLIIILLRKYIKYFWWIEILAFTLITITLGLNRL